MRRGAVRCGAKAGRTGGRTNYVFDTATGRVSGRQCRAVYRYDELIAYGGEGRGAGAIKHEKVVEPSVKEGGSKGRRDERRTYRWGGEERGRARE
ncbi:hypothetical protein V9T40_011719 [Parthenolecanium corni]|uniref:Uncharacterized protein n=1 Tax=Parthenolecanium corni TaxID=536013 RepID=A0AAN9XZS5_9HEMI